jgi:hypothetical protein
VHHCCLYVTSRTCTWRMNECYCFLTDKQTLATMFEPRPQRLRRDFWRSSAAAAAQNKRTNKQNVSQSVVSRVCVLLLCAWVQINAFYIGSRSSYRWGTRTTLYDDEAAHAQR